MTTLLLPIGPRLWTPELWTPDDAEEADENYMMACPDCAVELGEAHKDGCDVERCSACGGQRLSCDCADHDPRKSKWTCEWPVRSSE
jgi:hypothetical protein